MGVAKDLGKMQPLRMLLKFQSLSPEVKVKGIRKMGEMRDLAWAVDAMGNRSLCAIQMIATDRQGCVKSNQA